MQKQKFLTTKDIAIMSILIATEIVLSRFLSISTFDIKIGFAFVPVVIGAMNLGMIKTGTISALADLVGALAFPIGTYFPGFTFTAFLMGSTWGKFLHKKPTFIRILSAVLINQLIFSLLLNTFWITVLYGGAFLPRLYTRMFQTAVLVPVQTLVAYTLSKTKLKELYTK